MRDPGDFDIQYSELGPFLSLSDLTRAVWEEITTTAEATSDRGGGELVSHSYSVVQPVASEAGELFASVMLCFDTDQTNDAGVLGVSIVDLGPFRSLRAANGALAEEVAIGAYLSFERGSASFTGLSHAIVTQASDGEDEYFVSAAVSYRTETPTQH